MEPKRARTPTRPTANTPDSSAMTKSARNSERHYVILQGDRASIVTATETPPLTVKKGERRKRVMLASQDREKSQALADEINANSRLPEKKGA